MLWRGSQIEVALRRFGDANCADFGCLESLGKRFAVGEEALHCLATGVAWNPCCGVFLV